jgi:hypothetical protein
MLSEINMWIFIVTTFLLEALIYVWSVWSARQKNYNYFSISNKFIFEKCARNSGRVSAILNLIILLMIGYYGLNKIYSDKVIFIFFYNLIIAFTINHLIHFLFITQNFKQKSRTIKLSDEKHGIITFACITLFPIFLWYFKDLNLMLNIFIMLHLFNVSCAFVDVLYNKIRVKSKVTIHNKFGILATMLAWVYIAFRIFVELEISN